MESIACRRPGVSKGTAGHCAPHSGQTATSGRGGVYVSCLLPNCVVKNRSPRGLLHGARTASSRAVRAHHGSVWIVQAQSLNVSLEADSTRTARPPSRVPCYIGGKDWFTPRRE